MVSVRLSVGIDFAARFALVLAERTTFFASVLKDALAAGLARVVVDRRATGRFAVLVERERVVAMSILQAVRG